MTTIQNTSPKLKVYFLVVSTFMFFALAGKAEAAIFVDNAASGCANGATTYNPANRTCPDGSSGNTVYLTLNAAHTAIAAGTQGNPNIVNIRSGTNYSEKLNITKAWTTWQKYSGDAAKPVNDGNWTIKHEWEGLINIRATGVTLDGIEVKNTGHYPPVAPATINTARGYGFYAANVNNITIKNCYTQFTGGSGISLVTCDNVLLEDNEIYESEYSCTVRTNPYWAAAIQARTGCDHIVIRGNYIDKCGGEGMNLNRRGEDYLIEYNTIVDTRSNAIFPNHIRDVVIRYNLIYHTGDSRYHIFNTGISVAAEDWTANGSPNILGYATDIDVYGNLVAGYDTGIGVNHVHSGGLPDYSFSVEPHYRVTNTRFYNNTVIEPFSGGSAVVVEPINGCTETPIGSGVEFKNNIFWQTISTARISRVTHTGSAWSNNLWSKAPSREDVKSVTDPRYPLYGALNIADYFTKATGWGSLTAGSLTGQEFALRSTAINAIGKGTNLGAPYNQLLNLSTSNFKTNTFNLIDQNSQGAWEIGAGVYGGGDTTAPGSPSGLSVR